MVLVLLKHFRFILGNCDNQFQWDLMLRSEYCYTQYLERGMANDRAV